MKLNRLEFRGSFGIHRVASDVNEFCEQLREYIATVEATQEPGKRIYDLAIEMSAIPEAQKEPQPVDPEAAHWRETARNGGERYIQAVKPALDALRAEIEAA